MVLSQFETADGPLVGKVPVGASLVAVNQQNVTHSTLGEVRKLLQLSAGGGARVLTFEVDGSFVPDVESAPIDASLLAQATPQMSIEDVLAAVEKHQTGLTQLRADESALKRSGGKGAAHDAAVAAIVQQKRSIKAQLKVIG